jgi:hypothetical protein
MRVSFQSKDIQLLRFSTRPSGGTLPGAKRASPVHYEKHQLFVKELTIFAGGVNFDYIWHNINNMRRVG